MLSCCGRQESDFTKQVLQNMLRSRLPVSASSTIVCVKETRHKSRNLKKKRKNEMQTERWWITKWKPVLLRTVWQCNKRATDSVRTGAGISSWMITLETWLAHSELGQRPLWDLQLNSLVHVFGLVCWRGKNIFKIRMCLLSTLHKWMNLCANKRSTQRGDNKRRKRNLCSEGKALKPLMWSGWLAWTVASPALC